MRLHAPRMSGVLVPALALLALVWLLAPQQAPVVVYKVTLVTLAGVAGYALDRALFPYGRPHLYAPDAIRDCPGGEDYRIDQWGWLFIAASVRRSVIVGCAMLAVGLGL